MNIFRDICLTIIVALFTFITLSFVFNYNENMGNIFDYPECEICSKTCYPSGGYQVPFKINNKEPYAFIEKEYFIICPECLAHLKKLNYREVYQSLVRRGWSCDDAMKVLQAVYKIEKNSQKHKNKPL